MKIISTFSYVPFLTLIMIDRIFHVHRSCLDWFTVGSSAAVPLSQVKDRMCYSLYVGYVVSPLTTCQYLKLVLCRPQTIFCLLLKQTGNVHTDLSVTRATRVVISAKGAKMSLTSITVNEMLYNRAAGL